MNWPYLFTCLMLTGGMFWVLTAVASAIVAVLTVTKSIEDGPPPMFLLIGAGVAIGGVAIGGFGLLLSTWG